jgi:hypothetical protein
MHYNPFAYIHSEKDILKLVTVLIANTKGEGKAGEDFWVKAETLLYISLIGYIHYELPPEKQNFSTLIDMLNKMDVREDDPDYKNPVDQDFEKLAKKNPDHFAVRQYAKYRMATGKTAKSILVSCGARLAVFDIQELRDITAYDELHLDTIGEKRTALFLIMSDTDASFNFLISMVYSSSVSRMMVTGPSFCENTCISAAKRPVPTEKPRARQAAGLSWMAEDGLFALDGAGGAGPLARAAVDADGGVDLALVAVLGDGLHGAGVLARAAADANFRIDLSGHGVNPRLSVVRHGLGGLPGSGRVRMRRDYHRDGG